MCVCVCVCACVCVWGVGDHRRRPVVDLGLALVGSLQHHPVSTQSTTPSTRAAPKGGKAGAAQKAAAVADEDEHDDQLPAYTQVVEHSALVVQPLQSSNSASIN